MDGILRRGQRDVPAVEVDAIDMAEVGIAARLAAGAGEVDDPGLLVHPEDLEHVAGTAGDPVLELPGAEVVEVEGAPVVPFGEADELAGGRERVPVDAAVAGLEEGRHRL